MNGLFEFKRRSCFSYEMPIDTPAGLRSDNTGSCVLPTTAPVDRPENGSRCQTSCHYRLKRRQEPRENAVFCRLSWKPIASLPYFPSSQRRRKCPYVRCSLTSEAVLAALIADVRIMSVMLDCSLTDICLIRSPVTVAYCFFKIWRRWASFTFPHQSCFFFFQFLHNSCRNG